CARRASGARRLRDRARRCRGELRGQLPAHQRARGARRRPSAVRSRRARTRAADHRARSFRVPQDGWLADLPLATILNTIVTSTTRREFLMNTVAAAGAALLPQTSLAAAPRFAPYRTAIVIDACGGPGRSADGPTRTRLDAAEIP